MKEELSNDDSENLLDQKPTNLNLKLTELTKSNNQPKAQNKTDEVSSDSKNQSQSKRINLEDYEIVVEEID